jgi:hypothetical protein
MITSLHVNWSSPITIENSITIFDPWNTTLYVPTGTKALYQAAEGWKDFTNIVEE